CVKGSAGALIVAPPLDYW
nr:immunoglobulin heavy chain junction region [Macaca mulatta]MOW88336.1 immunoglobulin heavy chain junction region [Macaca mulatta]MOW88835.1 immunoglobulin heavy chain junction region [Macaca mulatta]MOW89212.1 immunoglobulin heavy chain junction region [Macaca mulatta]MOW90593.1 immunoglobulin heavy chain junction region [Macaca mulatta]